jgi:hypothetical protein
MFLFNRNNPCLTIDNHIPVSEADLEGRAGRASSFIDGRNWVPGENYPPVASH